jgi:archaeal flagellar protein FlaJ
VPRFNLISLHLFGKFVNRNFKSGNVDEALKKSKMRMGRVEFYSKALMVLLISVIILAAVDAAIIYYYPRLAFLILAVSFLISASILAIILETPTSLARRRRRRIDSVITIASGFFATMASAEVPIDIIFRDLGESRQYGEISNECRSIWIRSELFGVDIITSIKESIRNSPSVRFSEFLQGIVTSVNSGGDLKQYFIEKANQFQGELSTLIKQNSNSMSVLAESFVTVGVAFPLILLIVVGIVAFLSPTSPRGLITFLIITVAAIIPGILAIFAYFFSSTMGEIEL